MQRRPPRTVKVVVTGPFSAGKTTFIRTISEIPVLSTERRISDATAVAKPDTTVAMDFGRVTVGDGLGIYLFGTPGQDRFDFMWRILAEGMLGFVFTVDGTDTGRFDEARRMLAFFTELAAVPFVVAVNKLEGDEGAEIARVRDTLAVPARIPVLACDARDRDDVKGSLVALLEAVLVAIRARPGLVTGARR